MPVSIPHSASDAHRSPGRSKNRIEPSSAAHRLIALIGGGSWCRVVLGPRRDAEVVRQQGWPPCGAADAGGKERADDGRRPLKREACASLPRRLGRRRSRRTRSARGRRGRRRADVGTTTRRRVEAAVRGLHAGLGSLVVLVVLHDDPGRLEGSIDRRALPSTTAPLPSRKERVGADVEWIVISVFAVGEHEAQVGGSPEMLPTLTWPPRRPSGQWPRHLRPSSSDGVT
jgi:hypothetical protein